MPEFIPKGSMCSTCQFKQDDCSYIPFHEMRTIEKTGDYIVVRCEIYEKETMISEVGVKYYEVDGYEQPLAKAGNLLQDVCYRDSVRAGWWGAITPLTFSNKLMLVVSELAEAMEADRKGLKDDKLPHRDGREVELADAVIRIFDLAGAYGFNLGDAIAEKMTFNQTRNDHKPEVRKAAGGKQY